MVTRRKSEAKKKTSRKSPSRESNTKKKASTRGATIRKRTTAKTSAKKSSGHGWKAPRAQVKKKASALSVTPVEIQKQVATQTAEWFSNAHLPSGYNENKIVLQVRDPLWVHTYWELTPETVQVLKDNYGDDFKGARRILRVYDVTGIDFTGHNAKAAFDIEVQDQADNWYIQVTDAGRAWCIDFGFRLKDGRFVLVMRSNVVSTPLGQPSNVLDEEWMIPEDLFQKLFGRNILEESLSSLGRHQAGRLGPEGFGGFDISSWSMGSWGISSLLLQNQK